MKRLLFCLLQVWFHWTVLTAGGSRGMVCLSSLNMMEAVSRYALSRLRSKPSGSSSTLEEGRWASTTPWPKSISPHFPLASALLECSQLWAWAKVSWGCAAAYPLPLTCFSAKTRPTGGLPGPVKVGGAGRSPSGQWGRWYRSLRSWRCQTQTRASCPVLDRPAPHWLPFQMWEFPGAFPLGMQDRKLGLNKKGFLNFLFNGKIKKHPLLPEWFDLWTSFERLIFHLEGLLAASVHSLRDPGPAIDSLPRTRPFLSAKHPPLVWAWARESPL